MKILYRSREMKVVKSQYVNNDALYVGLLDEDGDLYGDVTVNLPNSGTLPSDCAFVDSNNMPNITRSLMEFGIAQPTGQSARSGFCLYNVFRFDLTKIDPM